MNILIIALIAFMAPGIKRWVQKGKKENEPIHVKRNELDEEARKVCGDDWIGQLDYKVKKSLNTLRESNAKDHPEEYYRDAYGLLQDKNPPKKENKIGLKTKSFKCPSCGAPLTSITENMKGICAYCGTEVGFYAN